MSVFDAVEIFVRVETVLGDAQNAHADVGTMVCDTLVIGKQVGENKAVADGAFSVLQALNVAAAQLIFQGIHHLLQRLYLGGQMKIIFHKGLGRQIDDFFDVVSELKGYVETFKSLLGSLPKIQLPF